MTDLVLFCGGPKIYGEGLPKPMRQMPSGISLLEAYLGQAHLISEMRVRLLVDSGDEDLFEKALLRGGFDSTQLISCRAGSSTLEKLSEFAHLDSSHSNPTIFSYPDIFYSAGFHELLKTSSPNKVVVGTHKQKIRFPRLNRHPYSSEVRSVETSSPLDRTNPLWVFSGFFASELPFLRTELQIFLTRFALGAKAKSLESDFFSFLANESKLQALEISESWLQADSERDLQAIEQLFLGK